MGAELYPFQTLLGWGLGAGSRDLGSHLPAPRLARLQLGCRKQKSWAGELIEGDWRPGPRSPLWDTQWGTDGCAVRQALALTPSKPTPHTIPAYTNMVPSTRHTSLAVPDAHMYTGAQAAPHATPAQMSTPCTPVEASKSGGRQIKSGLP